MTLTEINELMERTESLSSEAIKHRYEAEKLMIYLRNNGMKGTQLNEARRVWLKYHFEYERHQTELSRLRFERSRLA